MVPPSRPSVMVDGAGNVVLSGSSSEKSGSCYTLKPFYNTIAWILSKNVLAKLRGDWVRQRCHVSCVTGAFNWYWLTVGQGLLMLLSLHQVWVETEFFFFFISSVSLLSFIFLFLPYPSLWFPLLSLLSLFSLSLGDNTKWPTGVDVLLNPNTVNVS